MRLSLNKFLTRPLRHVTGGPRCRCRCPTEVIDDQSDRFALPGLYSSDMTRFQARSDPRSAVTSRAVLCVGSPPVVVTTVAAS